MARVVTPKFGEWAGSNTLTRQDRYSGIFAQKRAERCRPVFPESQTAPAAPAQFTAPREPSPPTSRSRPGDFGSSTIKLATTGTSPSLASIRRRHRNVAATMPASTASAALAAVRAARESSGIARVPSHGGDYGAGDGEGNEFCPSEIISTSGKRGGASRGGRIRAVDLFARLAEDSTTTKHDSAGFADESPVSSGKSKAATKAAARGSVKGGSLRGSYRGGGAGRAKPKSLKEYEAQLLMLAERLRLDDSAEDEQAAAAAAARLLLAAGRMGDPEAKLRLAAAVLASPAPDAASVAETVAGNWRGKMGIKLKSRASVIGGSVSARSSVGGKPGVGVRSGRVAPSVVETRIAAEVEELVAAAELAVEAVEVVEAEVEKAGEETGKAGDKQEGGGIKETRSCASGEDGGYAVAAAQAAELNSDSNSEKTRTGSAPGSPVAETPRGKVAMARAAARALLAAAGAALVAGSATKERVGRRWEQQRHAIGHAAHAVMRRRQRDQQPENSNAKAEDQGKRQGVRGSEDLRQNDKIVGSAANFV
ncbi:unnamed protein product [Closterium sp. Yama58-4]|nr:unnamed protein product [Closterium sp. Yama58-4]